jgi:AhpD family alkylhydroperoxidase
VPTASPQSKFDVPASPNAIFQQFLSTVGRPGGLDAVTKQAINIALCVVSRCEPCLEAHLKKAKKMGFSQAEIDEAAWLAIAFGGSPAMMFYKQLSEKVNAKG